MTIFKAFLKILNKCKAPIIMYTVILVFFGGFNMTTNEKSTNFVESKPKITIVNNDKDEGITKSLIDFLKEKSDFIQFENEEEINDALFYREVNYCIYIPEHFNENFMEGLNPKLETKTTNEYASTLAEMNLEKYLRLANIYRTEFKNEEEITKKISATLEENITVQMTSKLDTANLNKMTTYFNFTNYCILAGAIYVICLILSSFKNEHVFKRTTISSMNYKTLNRQLLLSNSLFALGLWFVYILLSYILIGTSMFTAHGLIYIINSLIFTITALTIAFLIGNLVKNKEAINGIVNVIALGSSFLCGAFVPMEWLPNSVLNIAHFLPSYWFIKNNEILKTIENINLSSLKPVFYNMAILLSFSILFIILTNIISKRKRKIN